MKPVFADSFFFFAILNRADPLHQRAAANKVSSYEPDTDRGRLPRRTSGVADLAMRQWSSNETAIESTSLEQPDTNRARTFNCSLQAIESVSCG